MGGLSTGAMLGIGAVGLVGIYLLTKNNQPAGPVVVRTVSPSSSSGATTAAEITAGAGVVTAALNDFFGPDDSGS